MPFWHFGAFLLRLGDEIPQFDQVEASGSQAEVESDLLKACMPELAKPGNHLGPTEKFFDLLAILQALPIAGMPGGAAIYRRPLLLAGNMWGDIELSHVLHMVGSVICFVGSDGDVLFPVSLLALRHLLGRSLFSRTIGVGCLNLGNKPVIVLDHGMSHDTEFGGCALALLVEPGVRVGG